MAKGKRQKLLGKRAANSWHAGLIVGTLTMVLSFELLAGPNLQRCPHSQTASTGIVQVLGAARDRAVESYRALRLAYQLQRSASDLEKQENSAQQQKGQHHATANASSDRHNI